MAEPGEGGLPACKWSSATHQRRLNPSSHSAARKPWHRCLIHTSRAFFATLCDGLHLLP